MKRLMCQDAAGPAHARGRGSRRDDSVKLIMHLVPLVLLGPLGCVTGCGRNDEPTRTAQPDVPLSTNANPAVRNMFIEHCASCHGESGRGDGPTASQLLRKPHNFVDEPWQRAYAGGSRDELLEDIVAIISDGLPDAAMPGYSSTWSAAQIRALAEYVFQLKEQRTEAERD